MRRREFIRLVGGAALVWPVVARAQQAAKLPRVGFIGSSTASAMRPWTSAFVQRLDELGWFEDRTIAIDTRFAEGHSDRDRSCGSWPLREQISGYSCGHRGRFLRM